MTVRLFLNGAGSHVDGKTWRDDVWKMDAEAFEARHDLIQWMFPTMTPSNAQPHSPVLTWDEVLEIQKDEHAQAALHKNCDFYTMFLVENPDIWLVGRDHNHLRITRVIQSLSLLVDDDLAHIFKTNVMGINAKAGWPVNIRSVDFWKAAMFYGREMRAAHK